MIPTTLSLFATYLSSANSGQSAENNCQSLQTQGGSGTCCSSSSRFGVFPGTFLCLIRHLVQLVILHASFYLFFFLILLFAKTEYFAFLRSNSYTVIQLYPPTHFFKKSFFIIHYLFILSVRHCKHLEAREQIAGVRSPPPRGFLGLYSGHQAPAYKHHLISVLFKSSQSLPYILLQTFRQVCRQFFLLLQILEDKMLLLSLEQDQRRSQHHAMHRRSLHS